jgi:hypothetical protein
MRLAIGDAPFGHQLLDSSAGSVDFGDGGGVELNSTAVGHRHHLIYF